MGNGREIRQDDAEGEAPPQRRESERVAHLKFLLQVQHALNAAGPLTARLSRGLPYRHHVGSKPGCRGGTRGMWRRRSGTGSCVSDGLVRLSMSDNREYTRDVVFRGSSGDCVWGFARVMRRLDLAASWG